MEHGLEWREVSKLPLLRLVLDVRTMRTRLREVVHCQLVQGACIPISACSVLYKSILARHAAYHRLASAPTATHTKAAALCGLPPPGSWS